MDGVSQRQLSERWLVPTSLLRGQQERFRHLRPLSLDLSRRLEADLDLQEALHGLGLNVYPIDGERVGPVLLDALADAWRGLRVPPGRFNVFLGQVRHAWQHLDESKGLPSVFLVRTARRRLEALEGDALDDVYLPDNAEKGRSLREGGTYVLGDGAAGSEPLGGSTRRGDGGRSGVGTRGAGADRRRRMGRGVTRASRL